MNKHLMGKWHLGMEYQLVRSWGLFNGYNQSEYLHVVILIANNM